MSQGYGLPVRICSLTAALWAALSTIAGMPDTGCFARVDTRTMETVGGYRIVRKLGAGDRAEIHLGHAGSREPPEGDRIAAIKVFRPATDDASIDREIEALARASSRHLLELNDLATGPDGRPCLILPRLGSGTLGRLLAVRGSIAPGEAVTLLVPLVEAVQELHRVGVAHGAVTSGSVLFDDRGAPVLARFGGVTLIGDFPATENGRSLTPAQLDEDPWAIDDRTGLRNLVATVLDRLEAGSAPDALAGLREELAGPPPTGARLSGLVDLLFALALALPIRFDEELLGSAESTRPMRLEAQPMTTGQVPDSRAAPAVEPAWPAGGLTEPLPSRAHPIEVGDAHPLARIRARILALLAPVRRPVWIAGGAGLGALVIALTVIPHSDTAAGVPAATPTVTRTVAASGPPTEIGVGATARPEAEVTSAIQGEDPLAAARALLTARTRCFTAKSTTCFDSVDQAGSAVIEADRDLVRRLRKGVPLPAEATLDGFTPRLIQQLGDSAIIQLVAEDGSPVTTKNPAPLLLVRNGAGWRIRDLALG